MNDFFRILTLIFLIFSPFLQASTFEEGLEAITDRLWHHQRNFNPYRLTKEAIRNWLIFTKQHEQEKEEAEQFYKHQLSVETFSQLILPTTPWQHIKGIGALLIFYSLPHDREGMDNLSPLLCRVTAAKYPNFSRLCWMDQEQVLTQLKEKMKDLRRKGLIRAWESKEHFSETLKVLEG